MASINYAAREISVKVVYYGPGLSGKTTNLQVIHKKVPPEFKSDMVSLATETDRTLFFDFLPLDLGKIKGFATKFQLYTVPGQVYYNATRKLVLRGVDGVVFVADSAPDKVQENLESFQNLEENLAEYGYKRESIPILIQYNKRDLPNALSIEELQKLINKYNLPWNEAVAYKGVGVFDSLKLIGKIVIDYLNKKYSRQGRPAAHQASAPQQPPQAPAQRQFAQPQQMQFNSQNAFAQPGTQQPAGSHSRAPMPPQAAPRQYSQNVPPSMPKQVPQFPQMPQQNPAQRQQQPVNRPFIPPVQKAPAQSYSNVDPFVESTFEPAPQKSAAVQPPPADISDSEYFDYGNIPLQSMNEQAIEKPAFQNPNQDQIGFTQNQQSGFASDEASQGQFEISDKTDLDLEIEKYQREIEEKQRRIRQSQSGQIEGQQYQAPSSQQYQHPAQYQQFQQPSAPQYQQPRQQYQQPAPQKPLQQSAAPQYQQQTAAHRANISQAQTPAAQSTEENEYDVYNFELSSSPAQNQPSAKQPAMPSEDNEEDMFFTSVDTDRQKKPGRKPVNPRTKQQKGFLSKFFNNNNKDTL